MTTITNPNPNLLRIMVLKQALRLQSVGMKHSRYSGKQLLDMASKFTSVSYRRGQYQQAATDLSVLHSALLSETTT